MKNIIGKLIYSLNRPGAVLVLGGGRECAAEAAFSVLSKYFPVAKADFASPWKMIDKKIMIFQNQSLNEKNGQVSFLIKKSKKPVIVLTRSGPLASDGRIIDNDADWEGLKAAVKEIPKEASLIYNMDSPMLKKAAGLCRARYKISIGFSPDADFGATDVKTGKELNFKARVKGSIIPVWLNRVAGKEQIYSAMAALAVGKIFELNLIQSTEAIRAYRSVSGRMRIIDCGGGLTVLDNAKSDNSESELEALEILSQRKCFGRRIAVLSDQNGEWAGRGKIIEEAALKAADFLFEIGFKDAAARSASELEKIFKSDMIDVVIKKLKATARDRDLILVGGSRESNFQAIVKELSK